MKKFKIFIFLICLFLPFSFAGCENVGKKTISTPNNLQVETNGIISFEMVKGASYYTISINDTTLNVFPNADENGMVERVDNTLFYDASRIFVLGQTYEVKVSAKAKEKNSKYSNIVTYTHAVSVEKPSNIKFNGTILTWDLVEHASYYVIKVVAPYNKVQDETPTGIANADLTEYHFSANRFDFSSLTTSAGEYKFFINAISLESNVLQSGFTSAISYKHKINLKVPTKQEVYKISEYNTENEKFEDVFHLQTIVDDYTNALNIKIGDVWETVYLDGNDANVKIGDGYSGIKNVVDINLSNLFKSKLDLLSLHSFQVSAQAIYVTPAEENYYIESAYSGESDIQNLQKLNAPTVQLNLNSQTNLHELVWEMESLGNVSGFIVLIKKADGITSVEVDANVNSMIMPEDFQYAWVQAKGKGTYTTSTLSECATHISINNNANIGIKLNKNILSWSRKDGKQFEKTLFVVQLNEQVRITSNPSINLDSLTEKIEFFKITVLTEGFAPIYLTCNLENLIRSLKTPSNLNFNSQSLYVLSFTGDDNAMGYYIYLNDKRIEKLFTSTTINLTEYVTESRYVVKVQAVANKLGMFKDSAISTGIEITHQQILTKPTFVLNDNGTPISKVKEGNQNKYYLSFNSVAGAYSYEILVNFNSLPDETSTAGVHVVDITNLITTAGKYTIMVRALPNISATNIKPSEFAIFDECIITQQLDSVTNIKITENDGKYTLTFDTQPHAVDYSVRILKVNDVNYSQYLSEQAKLLNIDLSNPFKTKGACDITEYLKQEGEYRVYVTALAQENSYYANSDESKEYAEENKRASLTSPSNFLYANVNNEEFNVAWVADKNADYFLVNIIDANSISHEIKVLNSSANVVDIDDVEHLKCNISNYLTSQGLYKIRIKALVNSTGENSAVYADSPFSNFEELTYNMTYDQDFERNSIFLNGEYFDNAIDDVEELKNVLWYNYLYEIDYNYRLRIKLNRQIQIDQGSGSAKVETTKNMLLRLGEDATASGLYDFESDEEWNLVIGKESTSDILNVLCDRLINLYPEMHLLKGLTIHPLSGQSDKFVVYYENALNIEKIDNEDNVFLTQDFGNKFKYLNENARRGSNSMFAIDMATETMNVTTTEQLLHAIQYGKRPVFVGDCEIAEQVYANAKQVLIATTSNNMTDLEKTTAIFDWISYAINNNFKSNYYINSEGVSLEASSAQIAEYGARKEFYLEGVFLDLLNETRGGHDGEFYLGNKAGTSEAYSKAFTLLCGIEGIETRKVNGTYTVTENNGTQTTRRHAWNKVNLKVSEGTDNAWFVADLMFSDTSSIITGVNNAQLTVPYANGISSHLFYLTSEAQEAKNPTKVATFLDMASPNNYPNTIEINTNKNDVTYNNKIYLCNTAYNYYEYSEFSIKKAESNYIAFAKDVTYTKHYNVNEKYNAYSAGETTSSTMQTFIVNLLVNAYSEIKNNESKSATLEFRFNHANNNNSPIASNIGNAVQAFNDKVLFTSQPDVAVKQTLIKQDQGYTTYVITLNVPTT